MKVTIDPGTEALYINLTDICIHDPEEVKTRGYPGLWWTEQPYWYWNSSGIWAGSWSLLEIRPDWISIIAALFSIYNDGEPFKFNNRTGIGKKPDHDQSLQFVTEGLAGNRPAFQQSEKSFGGPGRGIFQESLPVSLSKNGIRFEPDEELMWC